MTAAAAKCPKAAAPKAPRTCRLDGVVLSITADGVTDQYVVTERGSDCGRSFRLARAPRKGEANRAVVYDVSLSGDGFQACQCPAQMYRGTCRHCSALRALIEAGRLGATGYPG